MVVRVLDCFAGSGSVHRCAARHFPDMEVTGVDIKEETMGYRPTIVTDILKWDYEVYDPDHFDIVWLSPVCTQYSKARTTAKTPRNFELADALSGKAKEIAQYFTAAYVIENPRLSLLWGRPHMLDMPAPVWTDYCMYGLKTQKPTGLCSNMPLTLKTCRANSKCEDKLSTGASRHSQGCNRVPHTSESTAIVPELLIKSVFEQLLQ